jgi:hypothetical protein
MRTGIVLGLVAALFGDGRLEVGSCVQRERTKSVSRGPRTNTDQRGIPTDANARLERGRRSALRALGLALGRIQTQPAGTIMTVRRFVGELGWVTCGKARVGQRTFSAGRNPPRPTTAASAKIAG